MQWRSVTDRQNLAYIKALLALERAAPERQEYVHDYIGMLPRNPTFEQYRRLEKLKWLYPSELPEAMMSTGRPIYVATSFKYLRALLLPYKDAERCQSEAISRGYEGDDVIGKS